MNMPTKAAFIVRVRSLQEIDIRGGQPMSATGEVVEEVKDRYVRVSLEAHSETFDAYFGIPAQLFDEEVKIGDEYIISFTKK